MGGLATACNGLANSAAGLGDFQTAGQQYREALQIAAEIDFVPLVLTILSDIGRLLLKIGEVKTGGELLQIVLNHPASGQETKEEVQQTMEEYEGEPLPGPVDAGAGQDSINHLDVIVERTIVALDNLDFDLTTSRILQPKRQPYS